MMSSRNNKLFFVLIIISIFYLNDALGEEQSNVFELLKQTDILSRSLSNNRNETLDRNNDFLQLAMLGTEKLLSLDGNQSGAWIRKGDLLQIDRDYDGSLECYDQALRINPFAPLAWLGKGDVFDRQGRTDEAIDCYEKAICCYDFWTYMSSSGERNSSSKGKAWQKKGQVLALSGRNREALECFNKSLESFEDRYVESAAKVWIDMGLLNLRMENYKNATECFNKSRELCQGFDDKKEYAKALFNIGVARIMMNEYNASIECFDKAIESLDSDGSKVNDKDAWSSWFGKCIALDAISSNSPESNEAFIKAIKVAGGKSILSFNGIWNLLCNQIEMIIYR